MKNDEYQISPYNDNDNYQILPHSDNDKSFKQFPFAFNFKVTVNIY